LKSTCAPRFFPSALPPEGELPLDEFHLIVRGIELSRHEDLEQELTKRRWGQPKSAEEIHIEELGIQEVWKYRTGFDPSLWNILANPCRLEFTAFSFLFQGYPT